MADLVVQAMAKDNIVLALDQSSQTTGYAIYKNKALTKVGKFTIVGEFGPRLTKFRQKIKDLIQEYSITEVVFEEIQLQQNVDTFKKLAMVYGNLMELLTELKMPYEIMSSNTWKSKCKIKKSYREQEKKDARSFVENTYGIKVTEDEADAICIGYAHLRPDFDWSN